jgi:hypothetical protein
LGLSPEEELSKRFGAEEAAQDDSSSDGESYEGPDVVVEEPDVVTETPAVVAEKWVFHDSDVFTNKAVQNGPKKPRRGSRGAKNKKPVKKEMRNSSQVSTPQRQQPVLTESSVPVGKPYVKRPPKVAMVEYAVEAVLSHTKAKEFVQRTGRVVNILEFKHSRVAAGKNLE